MSFWYWLVSLLPFEWAAPDTMFFMKNALLAVLVITVLITGRPLVLEDVAALSDAILLAWYPGTEGGTAIAETILGLNNPGGKLPISFPRAEGAIPCFYHALRDRGNYVDCEGGAAYPFGFGLSYTEFEQKIVGVEGDLSKADGKVTVNVKVTNKGTVAGKDVVQFYNTPEYHDGGIDKAAVNLIGFTKTDII